MGLKAFTRRGEIRLLLIHLEDTRFSQLYQEARVWVWVCHLHERKSHTAGIIFTGHVITNLFREVADYFLSIHGQRTFFCSVVRRKH